jgi:hypothetical protein
MPSPIPQTLESGLKRARGSAVANVLTATTVAIGFVAGGLGIVAGVGIDKIKNEVVASDQKKVLVNHFREQIAAQLGMDPSKVTVRDLDKAAEVNPAFRQLVGKVNREKDRADRTSIMAAGAVGAAGVATGGGLLLPGAAEITRHAATLGLHGAAAVGGGLASNLFNKDVLEVEDVMTHINGKVSQGQAVSSFDVMLLRIAQDEMLQKDIKQRGGKAFHQMNESEQRAVTAALPDLYAAAETDAQALNAGRISDKDLLVASPGQAQSSWTSRVGGRRARQGSFVQAYEAESAAGVTRTR